jgi:hypothetical protein
MNPVYLGSIGSNAPGHPPSDSLSLGVKTAQLKCQFHKPK